MIDVKQLDFSYSKKRKILNGLNLHMEPGNIYGLLGKNGAGKSTLLKNLGGLLFPKSGSVSVLGYPTQSRFPQFLREIYFIPEEFELPEMRIRRYVDLNAPFYPGFDLDQFNTILREFDLDDNLKLTSLSYGQKKKVIIGFGLASNCKFLIMDEPTNGLDIPSKSLFRRIVASSVTDERCFVISTHQVKDVENMIDPILIMDKGEIIFHQSLDSVSRSLRFTKEKDLGEDSDVIYSESTMGGHLVIRTNSEGPEDRVDLELLFNAVSSDSALINKAFNH